MAGPQEASKAVAEAARHDVEVYVGDALAHDLVEGEEGPLGPQGGPLRRRHPSPGQEQVPRRSSGVSAKVP